MEDAILQKSHHTASDQVVYSSDTLYITITLPPKYQRKLNCYLFEEIIDAKEMPSECTQQWFYTSASPFSQALYSLEKEMNPSWSSSIKQ